VTAARRAIRRCALVALVVLAGCGGGEKPSGPLPGAGAKLDVRSPAFPDGATIPRRFTCDGAGVSPPLSWSGVPRGARSLALVVEDEDAGRFVHWTVLDIAGSAHGLAQGRVPAGAVQTDNSFGRRGWGGPCPPKGDAPHHYVFALYATRAPLGLGEGASPDDVRAALAKAAIARGVLTGLYARG
jgi:Raf kinase inhibitor-like YbhB/YbcL family protein